MNAKMGTRKINLCRRVLSLSLSLVAPFGVPGSLCVNPPLSERVLLLSLRIASRQNNSIKAICTCEGQPIVYSSGAPLEGV
jgi:hypothetical protein